MNATSTIRIGNGCGFYGDQLDAPRDLVRDGRLDFLTLEYLAELTLSILARQREKDSSQGYARDFLYVLETLVDALQRGEAPRIVTNAGGMNAQACAQAASEILCRNGLSHLRIGIVTGDDIMASIDGWLEAGEALEHLDHGRSLAEVRSQLVSANAYLGASPIVEALREGADIVITGRVADASLTVGPARYAFGWEADDLDRLAQATLAGHLIECGAQVTGGYTTDWEGMSLADVGYPIAELGPEGQVAITKPPGTGGAVTVQTVTEQLLYEVGDPSAYLTPDLALDLSQVKLEQIAPDTVAVSGARAPFVPDRYKVSAAYRAGYQTAGQLVVYGRDCLRKADAVASILLERVRRAGFELDRICVEKLGTGASVPRERSNVSQASELREVVLRIAVAGRDRAALERFSREWAPLVTSGPAGLGGYTTARQPIRPVYAFWPTTVPKALVDPHVSVAVRSADEWRSEGVQ